MKRIILSVLLVTFVGLASCTSEKKKEHGHEHSEEMVKTEYYCSMECEGDKTYTDKDATCPKCKMKLVEKKVEGNHKGGKEHSKHEGKDGDSEPEGHDKDGKNHGEKEGHDSDEKH